MKADRSSDRVAIVTGGTFGIGRAITVRLALLGYRVVALGLDDRQIGSVAEGGRAGTQSELAAAGLEADLLEADVSSRSDVENAVAWTMAEYGRIDALVNNAAIHPYGTLHDTTDAVWDRVLAVNLFGVFVCTQEVVRRFSTERGGAIVNIGSASGWGRPNLLAYSASKGGVFAMSSALAHELRPQRVRVNVVVPGGWVSSGMTQATEDGASANMRDVTGVAGRPVEGADIASAVGFLVSPEAEQISGAILNVGGHIFQAGSTL